MLDGTKKLFPTDYKKFAEAMLEEAEDESLPTVLQLNDIKDFTLADLQDLFLDFTEDTGLKITGTLFMCNECGMLHLLLEVDYPDENQKERILQ